MNNKISMIAFDLDGTLLTSEKVFTEYTKQVLAKVIAKGIVVLPATGRPLTGIPQELLEFPGIRYAVTANGARIVDTVQHITVYEKLVSVEIARNILDIFQHYDTLREVYYNGVGFAEMKMLDRAQEFLEQLPMAEYVRATRRPVADLRAFFEAQNASVDKVQAIFTCVSDKERALSRLQQVDDIAITGALSNNIEVNAVGVNKGKALLRLGEQLGIAREEILAFGDGANDLEMMQQAGCGVCMGNGMAEVKDAADYLALTNDEEGVAKFLEQMILV